MKSICYNKNEHAFLLPKISKKTVQQNNQQNEKKCVPAKTLTNTVNGAEEHAESES